jgi:transposase InsO family protein
MENLEGFYNRQYRHFALGYLSPAEVEERPGLVIY